MFTIALLLQTGVAQKNALVALILLFTRRYMDNLQCTCCSPTFPAGTWTSAWVSPCLSPWSPWSTAPCPASAGRLLFSSYLGDQDLALEFIQFCFLKFSFPNIQVGSFRFCVCARLLFSSIVSPKAYFNQLAVWLPFLAIGFGFTIKYYIIYSV